MIWLTWRQHRSYVITGLGLLTALTAVLVPTGLYLRRLFDQVAVPCLGTPAANTSHCTFALQNLASTLHQFYDPLLYLNLLPAFAGVFVGAPLVAREVERGTHRLVWTQNVSRLRWVAAKLAMLLTVTVLLAVPLTALVTWWLEPETAIYGTMQAGSFDFLGLMPAVHAVFAFALGAALGCLILRTVPAMAATLGGFLAVFLAVHSFLREHYLPALTRVNEVGAPAAARGVDWILANYLVDHTGSVVPNATALRLCPDTSDTVWSTCLRARGIGMGQTYQPASRFWPFQIIETSIFLGVALVLITVAVWLVNRRLD